MYNCLNDQYPIDDEGQIKTALQFFDMHITRFCPAERVKIAAAIDSRARELGVHVEAGWVKNYSRMTKTAELSPTFRENLYTRNIVDCEMFGKSSSYVLDKIAHLAETTLDRSIAIGAIEEFDKLAGLSYGYDSIIPDPVMTLYGNLQDPSYDEAEGQIKHASDDSKMEKCAELFGAPWVARFKANPDQEYSRLDHISRELFDNA